MGTYVFNNQLFDSWLDKKSDEILSKVDREKITTEEMIILVLKAQTNHFHHADIDMKEGMKSLADRFDHLEKTNDAKFLNIDQRFEKVDQRFEKIDQRFIQMDHKIDNRFMWMIGVTIAMSGGIYLKLFLG